MQFQEGKVHSITFTPDYKRIKHILSRSVMVTPQQQLKVIWCLESEFLLAVQRYFRKVVW